MVSTRIHLINIEGVIIDDFKYSDSPSLGIQGNPLTTINFSNSIVNNYHTYFMIFGFRYISKLYKFNLSANNL